MTPQIFFVISVTGIGFALKIFSSVSARPLKLTVIFFSPPLAIFSPSFRNQLRFAHYYSIIPR